MKPHVAQAFLEVGRAVWNTQLFEGSLIPIYELFKMNTEPGYAAKTGGYLPAGAFKNPIANLVKQLDAKGHISTDMKSKLEKFLNDRHTVIHRWFLQNGWPADDDVESWKKLQTHATVVANTAQELTHHFTGYIVKYANPGSDAFDTEAYEQRILDLFK